ncbi:hypothetical protein EN836_26915 [Mesorhizobium sp. M1C.F.Ca.ET.193.01.1.1]|uniref:hypothetical protein n=1 Tax=unclassified Mesorhizobium TaxID=325217 RepID=UPI000FD31F84|nr:MULTISPECIES: hypothetical protein [unclassified Mesorhizobium]TGQ66279.1 hypothetical protein EN855_026920 [Mesorhizobium sp. M1C.F.Ca.ET.212.01.1.1]TGR00303.1 hypothetical protein EN847_26910 [Mesorhizobium sp. M1C.F.Ca.ET.204.01.1.1]TGR20962.1 hypothetical protein EN839_26910 [Mesorhizobium sp. M1C.F.Ca.ET.196.01.1.1]TGR74936.1 hypothetical protein EN832_26925 [Mesorhizobium sp. M1C.F.Ca.ET.189.01.1.1]TGS22223.1 hypothetical protein EN830_26915 [Mesorhizobium sp. M1C.F.Ca.ET.187.01.1.1]
MHPSKCLQRCFGGREGSLAVHGRHDRDIVVEGDPIVQSLELGVARLLVFDRESDEIILRIVDIEAKQAHLLAAPEF